MRTVWTGVVGLATACAVLGPGPAKAWGPDGHEVVGRIADNFLSPTARQGVTDLLQGGQYPSIATGKLANWADAIRGSSFYNQKYMNMAKWHFIDIPVTADLANLNLDDFCQNGDCALAAIKRFRKTMRESQEPRDRREAVYFLVHFLGDIHQPLHCAERNGDRGGNLLRVHMPHDPHHVTNLHKVWDTELVHAARGDLSVADYAQRLINMISLESKAKYQKGKVEDWIVESHKVAREKAYGPLPAASADHPNAIPTLKSSYVDQGAEVVNEQLIKGGLRLAFFLNEALRED